MSFGSCAMNSGLKTHGRSCWKNLIGSIAVTSTCSSPSAAIAPPSCGGELALPLDLGVGLGVGAGEDEAAHAPGMPQRQLLRDHPAHRHADDVRALDRRERRAARRRRRPSRDGVRAGGLRAAADAALSNTMVR